MSDDRLNNSGKLKTTHIVIGIVLGVLALSAILIAAVNNVNAVPENKKAIKEISTCVAKMEPKVEANAKEIERINKQGSIPTMKLVTDAKVLQTQFDAIDKRLDSIEEQGQLILERLPSK